MSCIRILICRVDDPSSDTMTELAAFDLPTPHVAALRPETALDDLETSIQATGQQILQRVLQAQWEAIDSALAEQYRQAFPPSAGPR